MSRTAFLMATCAAASALPSQAIAQASAAGQSPSASSRATAYESDFFVSFAPRTALDMVQRVPGFSLDLGSSDLRGFGGAAGNVIVNGQRPSTKSETLQALLSRIPASRVARIEVGPGDLYGSEYSSKPQVANVILKTGAGMSANASATAWKFWNGRIKGTASGSLLISRGPSTFTLSADAGRNDYFEDGFDRLTDAVTAELIELRHKSNVLRIDDPFVSASWALQNGDTRSAHINLRYAPSSFYLRQSNHVMPAGAPVRDDLTTEDYRTPVKELGADVTLPLGAGALKFLALLNLQKRHTFDETLNRSEGGVHLLGGLRQFSDARRNESIGRVTWSKPSLFGFQVEAGGEIAYNMLDYHLELFELGAHGSESSIDLPIADATVRELRGEVYVTAGKPLTSALRADFGINYEKSRLRVRGDALANRSLAFLKPSVTLDWHPNVSWHAQLIVRRTVAQLDFFDFVSSSEFTSDRVNGGNADLQPQRTWEARAVLEHPVFGEGKIRAEVGHDQISLLQDRILTPEGFDAPGNLGTGKRSFLDLTFDSPLGILWKGLRLRAHGLLQRTRVKDPISREARDFSGFFPHWQWDGEIRKDAGKLSVGVTGTDNGRYTFFRTDEFDNQFMWGAQIGAYVEYRPTPRTTFVFNATNLLDKGAGGRDRFFFRPNRADPEITQRELRNRNSHVQLSITLKRSFEHK